MPHLPEEKYWEIILRDNPTSNSSLQSIFISVPLNHVADSEKKEMILDNGKRHLVLHLITT